MVTQAGRIGQWARKRDGGRRACRWPGLGPVPGKKLAWVCGAEPRDVPGCKPWTNGKLSRIAKVRVPPADLPRFRATQRRLEP